MFGLGKKNKKEKKERKGSFFESIAEASVDLNTLDSITGGKQDQNKTLKQDALKTRVSVSKAEGDKKIVNIGESLDSRNNLGDNGSFRKPN